MTNREPYIHFGINTLTEVREYLVLARTYEVAESVGNIPESTRVAIHDLVLAAMRESTT